MATSNKLTQTLSKGSTEVVEFPCSVCRTRDKRDVESSNYCVDCDANMCAACTESHACWPAMASHQVVDISKASGTPAQKPQLPTQRCAEHHGKIIDQYCQDDDRIACEIWVNVYHRTCGHMKYIPTIAKGTSKGTGLQAIKKSTVDLTSQLKNMKSSKEGNLQQLDQAEAKAHLEVQDLKTRLHQHVDNLADSEDAKILFEFQKKKGDVQMDLAAIDDQIVATESISKKLNDYQGDNESELFVYIKQGEKVEMHVTQKLQALSRSKVEVPTYTIDSNIEKSLKDVKALGQFRHRASYTAVHSAQIKVRAAEDRSVCAIKGMCLLPDASMALADYSNNCLMLVDPSHKRVGSLKTISKPFDVCYTDKNEIAVTMPHANKIEFVSVPALRKTQSFSVGDFCRGIDSRNCELFVCCGNVQNPGDACVKVYSLSGTLLCEVKLDQLGQKLFTMPQCITISSCGSKLHVTDNITMVTLDRTGRLLATYTDPELKSADGICCLEDGNLLICDSKADCVLLVTESGEKQNKILTAKDGIKAPLAVCYDPAHSSLFVSMDCCDTINVYNIE